MDNRVVGAALVAALLLPVSACCGGGSSSSGAANSEVTTLDPGVLKVWLYPGFPPFAIKEDDGWTGWDPECFAAFAKEQGIRFEPVEAAPFNGIDLLARITAAGFTYVKVAYVKGQAVGTRRAAEGGPDGAVTSEPFAFTVRSASEGVAGANRCRLDGLGFG
jgi:hypothetical protein